MGHGDFEQSVGKQWFDPSKPSIDVMPETKKSLTHTVTEIGCKSQFLEPVNVKYFLSLGHLMA